MNVLTALQQHHRVDTVLTSGRGDAEVAARHMTRSNSSAPILVVGGDGTLNEVVNGLMSTSLATKPPLLLVPAGGTNVVAGALGLDRRLEFRNGAALHGDDFTIRSVQLGRVNDRFFVGSVGLGVDARVLHRVQTARDNGTPGSLLLVLKAIAQELRDREPPRFRIMSPIGNEDDYVWLAAVNLEPWTYVYDKPIRLTAKSNSNTGLGLIALRQFDFRRLSRILRSSFRSAPTAADFCLSECEYAQVQSVSEIAIQVDGEFDGGARRIELKAVPEAIRFLVPKRREGDA